MAEAKAQKAQKLTSTVVFQDARFDNITIVWPVGSKRLELCSKGGTGAILVLQKTYMKGDVDAARAEKEASEWFDSLGGVWEDTEFGPDYGEEEEYR